MVTKTRSRRAAVALIQKQLTGDTKTQNSKQAWHYGLVELRELLDFIYDSKPRTKLDELKDNSYGI